MFGPFRGEGSRSLNELQDEMNRVIKRFWHTGISTGPLDGQECAPPWDVCEDAERYIARVELPGLGDGEPLFHREHLSPLQRSPLLSNS